MRLIEHERQRRPGGATGGPQPDRVNTRRLHAAGIACAAATCILGLIGMTGWIIDVAAMRRAWTPGTEIKFNAATCMAAIGAALMLLRSQRWLKLRNAFAGLVLLIASFTLSQLVLPVDWGINELFFTDRNLLGTMRPGQMAWQSVVTFILLSLGIFLSRRETPAGVRPSQWLALAAMVFPAQALMGYAYGRMIIAGLQLENNFMAIPAATGFAFAAIALLLDAPDRHLLLPLVARTQASRVTRQLILAALVLPPVLGWCVLNLAGGQHQPAEYSVATLALLTSLLFVTLVWLNAARINAEERARRAREREYALLVENLPDVIFRLDAHLRHSYVSPAAHTVFGHRADAFLGRTVREIGLPECFCNQFEAFAKTALATGNEQSFLFDFRDRTFSTRLIPETHNDSTRTILGITTDITDRRQAEAALRESELQFRTLSDNIPQLAWMADPAGQLFWYNRRWFEHTGTTLAEMLGWGWEKVQHADHLPRVLKSWGAALAAGQPWQDIFPLRRHDGHYTWFLSRAFPIRDENGKIARWFGTNTDITELRQTEFELKHARDEALAASKAKDDFLARLSHELRTPLNPVLLLTSDDLRTTTLPADWRDDFEMIRKNVELEARLIDDLLDLTSIRTGKLVLTLGEVSLNKLIRDALAHVAGTLHEKKIAIRSELAPDDPKTQGDAVRLQQVFWNLFRNAAKFSPDGSVINVSTRLDADGSHIVAQITDQGIGLTSAEIARIFEAFSQGDHASGADGTASPFGGLGLGLAISRSLVTLHRGTIHASSPGPGLGATFTITLPRIAPPEGTQRGQHPAHAASSKPSSRDPFGVSARRILVVDDHEPTRIALQRLLVRRGYTVVTCGSLHTAREAVLAQPPHLLLCDIGLPDGTGYELMRELRLTHDFPGIALSGYGMAEDIAQAHAAGFLAHITKPVRVQALDEVLARAFPTPAS